MNRILGSLIVLAIPALLSADCRVVTVRAVVHRPAVFVEPVIATTFVGIPTPVYSVGYGMDLTPLLEELRKLRLEVQALRGPVPGAVKERHPGLAVMQNKCATCHGPEVAAVKGGKTVLFKDGEFIEAMLDKAVEQLELGKMPKDGKLTDREQLDVLRYLVIKPVERK